MSGNAGASAGRAMGRREFLSRTGAAAAGITILQPSLVRGTQASSAIELGLIGCGGRGQWIANLFAQNKGFRVVAVGDYFADRAQSAAKRLSVDAARCYTGLANHKRLLEGKLDAVVVQSPPYFHPEQCAAAVEAGKHVYVAKPIAVDVPGCMTIAEAGRKATARKLAFLVDFQTRADAIYQEAVKRVQNGDIGRLVNGVADYFTGFAFAGFSERVQKDPDNPEVRLRCWQVDQILSGDIITEQNIHALDVACWIMGADPLWAVGTGGRKLRTGKRDIYDHFNLVYGFPNDVPLSFISRQFGKGLEDIGCLVHGTRGAIDTHYFGDVRIIGDVPFPGGRMADLYRSGAVSNIETFRRCIVEGRFDNPTVPESVRSNLTTILGRIAAYTGRKVTWDEMIKANEKLEFPTKGLKD